MKGIPLPERTEDFTADPVELFFDLAYVFAFSQLVGALIADHTWSGVGKVALLFLLLWLPWQQLTWSANAVSGNGRRVRLAFLAGTVVSVPMAASAPVALESGGTVFAVSLALIMAIGFYVQVLGAPDGSEFQRAVLAWVLPNAAAVAILVAGSYTEGSTRIWLWSLAVAIVIGAMVAAGKGQWIVRSGHMAERHGLIVIIALGEVIVAIGVPVVQSLQAGETLPGLTTAALVASGVFAGLLWWSYFDRPGPALEHRAEALTTDTERGRYVRDVYTWGHAPIVAGIILAAASLEEIALHPSAPIETSFRLMLAAGLALILGGVVLTIWRAFHRIAVERLVGIGVIAVAVALTAPVDGLVVLALVVGTLFATLVIEHVRLER